MHRYKRIAWLLGVWGAASFAQSPQPVSLEVVEATSTSVRLGVVLDEHHAPYHSVHQKIDVSLPDSVAENWENLGYIDGAATTVLLDNLQPATTYHFMVCAWDFVDGDQCPGPVVSATTVPVVTAPPGTPSDVVAVPVTGQQILVTWVNHDTQESGLTKKFVRRFSAGGGVVNEDVDGDATSLVVTGLQRGVSYRFRVCASNSLGLRCSVPVVATTLVD